MARIAFHSHTTRSLSVQDDLKLAKQTGYNGIICSSNKIQNYLEDNNQKNLRELVKDSGLAVFGISNIHIDLMNINEQKIGAVKRFSRLVRTMKGNFISITPEGSRNREKDGNNEELYITLAQNLAVLAEGAEEYGVYLSIEQEKPHTVFSSPVTLTYIINKTGKDNLGFVFDPFSYMIAGISLEEVETMEGFFHIVYLSDLPDKRNVREKDRLIPGEGSLDFERILKIIHRCDYKGVFALKLFSAYRTKKRNRQLLREAREPMEAYLEILNYL